ncbi:MAG: Rv2231c family pyridoxal phosphate-dependent protein CobC [Motilibacteraceae bacterium]
MSDRGERVVDGVDLEHHGDADAAEGLVDLAVNVRPGGPPPWLHQALADALAGVGRYPDPAPATAAVAAQHGRPIDEVLLTSGAAEAFVLLARALAPRRALVVHPQFTEPERALRAAGYEVVRHQLAPRDGFVLNPDAVDPAADLVVVGNPTNPTGVLHPAESLRALARPGRTLVVDEAFMDAVPGEPASLAAARDVPGLVVVRSLTKTWALAGLRVGYLLAAPDLVARCRAAQPRWAVSSPALAATLACSRPSARAETAARAVRLAVLREDLRGQLHRRGLRSVPRSQAPFLLVHDPAGRALVPALRAAGVAVRPANSFPGLDRTWFRTAVRDDGAHHALPAALDHVLVTHPRRFP